MPEGARQARGLQGVAVSGVFQGGEECSKSDVALLLVGRIKEMVDLVYDTIREPKRIVDIPVGIGKLLAAPRERFFKSVGPQIAYSQAGLHAYDSHLLNGLSLPRAALLARPAMALHHCCIP